MVKSQYRGYEIHYVNNKWIYADTKEDTVKNIRPCGYCNKFNTKEGHDGCLGSIPNIMNACCGHGVITETYVQFLDSVCVRGKDAIKFIEDSVLGK